MAQRRLTGLDSAFLAAEGHRTPLHMLAVLLLDPSTVPGGYSFDKFREFLASRLHLVSPLRRRLVEVPGGLARPLWVEDPDLDLDLHLHRVAVPSPGGARELAAMAADLYERRLPRTRPLWEMRVVEGVENGRIAVLAKLHHSMMDGMAGMQFMASLFRREAELDEPPKAEREPPEAIPSALTLLAGAIPGLVGKPLQVARAAAETVRWGLRRARSDDDALQPVSVPHSWLNARTTAHRSVAYLSLPLEKIKATGHSAEATLNDVILAVVSGALRQVLEQRGALPDQSLVAGVPASTHEQGDELANAYSALFLTLATDITDPAERLSTIRDAARCEKERHGMTGSDALVPWMDVPPPFFFSLLAGAYDRLALAERLPPLCNLILSNVPGPSVALYFGGARLLGLYPLGPIYDGVTLNVTALSCEDSLDIGLVACHGRMPDLWELADAIPVALEELVKSVARKPARRRRSSTTKARAAHR